MKALSLRIFFISALLASLGIQHYAAKAKSGPPGGYDISAAIAAVAADNGLTLLDNPVRPPKVLSSVVYFQRAGCRQPALAMPFAIYVDAMTQLRRLNKPNYSKRIYFLDQSWATQDRVGLFLAWQFNALRSVVGATPYLPVKHAFALAEPQNCATLKSIDWRPVWHKQRTDKAAPAAVGVAAVG